MRFYPLRCYRGCLWTVSVALGPLVCLGLALSLTGCQAGGDSQGPASPAISTQPPTQLTQQAVTNLLTLYRQAVLQEDIDRVQELLVASGVPVSGTSIHTVPASQGAHPTTASRQAASPTFLEALSGTFRQQAITAFELSDVDIQVAPVALRVTVRETLSGIAFGTTAQETRSQRTTLTLTAQPEAGGTLSMRLAAVHYEAPQVQVRTPGQIVAGVATRIEVAETTGTGALTQVDVEVPETGAVQRLAADGAQFQGSFLPPTQPEPQPLRLRLYSPHGEVHTLRHPYRVRVPGEGVVQAVPGADTARLFAVAVAPDGTVWAGGDQGGLLYQVVPGASMATVQAPFLVDPQGRIEDIIVDRLGRLHILVFAAGSTVAGLPPVNQDIVQDGGIFCGTANAFDPAQAYPFRVTRQGELHLSASTRLLAARGGTVWLLGSDGGAALVADTFRDGHCPETGVQVTYAPIFSREQHGLPANTVPALVERADGTLWFGTVLGLARFRDGQVTPLPFRRALRVPGHATTLEAFFQEVAAAIFDARPLSTVALGDVSFVAEFGAPLQKEDVIFSAVEDGHGRLWVGTLGGGLRRLDGETETLHLTRQNGLGSNIILALAVGPDGSLWAATDEGVSRLQDSAGQVRITNFSALDGLTPPVRDVAVAPDGTVWLATDGGLVRLATQAGRLRGIVQDSIGTPVGGAEILVLGTPVQTVTDAAGQFVLANVPLGLQHLRFAPRLVTGGPFTAAFRAVEVMPGEQTLAPVDLVPLAPRVTIDPAHGGVLTFPAVPGAQLTVPAQTVQFPPGIAPEIGLTLLPLRSLPFPLPEGLIAVAAADLQPEGVTFTTPVSLTLPNQGQLPPGRLVVLLHLNTKTLMYEEIGRGQVSADGTVITTISGGLLGFSTVVFAGTPLPDRARARLIRVSGNNQSGQPGQLLPAPLVVRLEDQFRNPVVGEVVTAEILRGAGELQPVPQEPGRGQTSPPQQVPENATTTTNAQGEAAFTLLVQSEETDIVVQVSAPRLEVRPVQFLAIVGTVDTPNIPFDLAVAGDFAYIADFDSGLQIIDVSNPAAPTLLHTVNLQGAEERLALAGDRAYVVTREGSGPPPFPPRLHILDITNPRAPDLPADTNGDGMPDVVLGRAALPEAVQEHQIRGIAVQGGVAYVVTDAITTNAGTLQVVDISNPAVARIVGNISLPDRPSDIAVSGKVAYVPAEEAGLLIFDVSNPASPRQVGQLGDPDSSDTIESSFLSGIALAGGFAYVVETQCARGVQCNFAHARNFFTVLDLSDPGAPRRRGTVQTRVVFTLVPSPIALAGQFAYLLQGPLGLQAIDISNPDAPRLVGSVDTPSVALNVATAGQFIYVTDQNFGLQVIRGPGADAADADGDGVIDFFDVFPNDPREVLDTDRDGLGNNADPDDDNDGFTDDAEQQATPPTNSTDPRNFPLRLPPPEATTIVIDANALPGGNGTPEAPYRSITTGIRVLTEGGVPQVTTLLVRAGTYSPSTTQEIFPLDFVGLSHLTVQGEGWETTIIDAEFAGDVVTLLSSTQIVIDGFTLTHGADGLFANEVKTVTIRRNRVVDNIDSGIEIGVNSTDGNTITENIIHQNGSRGIDLFAKSAATISHNILSRNRLQGINIDENSTATLIANNIRESANVGIFVHDNSTAEIIANTATDNAFGIVILNGSEARIVNNTITHNTLAGIAVDNLSTAEITANTITDNDSDGVRVRGHSTAMLTDNTVRHNGDDGIQIGVASDDSSEDGSFVAINGGTIAENTGDGVGLIGASTATIGLDGDVLTLAQNGGTGIFVTDDGSLAHVNRARIVFNNNTGGDIVGPVDTDLDGLSDAEEALLGTNPNSPDTDGDTFSDGVEVASDSDPLDTRSTPTMILYGAAHAGRVGLSTLYVLNPRTGEALRVGTIGVQRVSGMDVRADGIMYATGVSLATGQHVLLTIDPVTGAGIEVGPTGVESLGFTTVTDLSFRHADNALYAYFAVGDAVGTIDPVTAQATVLGPSEIGEGNGLAFSATDTLFHAATNSLRVVDQRSGAATIVADLQFSPPAENRPRINAMDFLPDTPLLFVSVNDGSADMPENYLAMLNTATGAVSIIGRTVNGLDALTWFPVP